MSPSFPFTQLKSVTVQCFIIWPFISCYLCALLINFLSPFFSRFVHPVGAISPSFSPFLTLILSLSWTHPPLSFIVPGSGPLSYPASTPLRSSQPSPLLLSGLLAWRGEVDQRGPTVPPPSGTKYASSNWSCWESLPWASPAWCCVSSKASSTSIRRAPLEVSQSVFMSKLVFLKMRGFPHTFDYEFAAQERTQVLISVLTLKNVKDAQYIRLWAVVRGFFFF